ncbi:MULTISPECIES: M67 family metallopeptidase [unclassified Coleofasciculus]|uniref:M67 family metallopeptidase n=1 Tax=unclassified Coleofasciculus TaxID=2692782 RepID=UPI00187F78F0|nr:MULTISPECIES: M67 family metallopeptidase [unclassified Coleofasciculus]MBE9126069.1 M67 family metallopeptidase [Coleofasciculus sp. LEGE 07081]MBE9149482.1 M67 family metallopeptidase [Coleofasciculus sp. LEGE 07092]
MTTEGDFPPSILKLHSHHLQAMQTHAEGTYPEECCGLLLGQLQGTVKTLIEVLPTENAWDDETIAAFQAVEGSVQPSATKRNHFTIAPEVMLKVQKEARDRNLNIIGIFHSHPDHPAVPSPFDQAIAWQQYSYIIISVQQGITRDLRSWSLDDEGQFQPEEILTVEAADFGE